MVQEDWNLKDSFSCEHFLRIKFWKSFPGKLKNVKFSFQIGRSIFQAANVTKRECTSNEERRFQEKSKSSTFPITKRTQLAKISWWKWNNQFWKVWNEVKLKIEFNFANSKYEIFLYLYFNVLDEIFDIRRTHDGTSSSHPMLNYNQNGSSPRNLFTSSSSRSQTQNKSTQTPDSIERETRRHKLRSLKINFNNVPTPSLNFKLGFLNQKKRSNLTANAVATEQKASKVLK